MGCQREVAKQLIKGKADYVFALKGNHSGLQAELEAWLHKCQQLAIDVKWLDKNYRWTGLKSTIKITYQVEDKATGKVTRETRWYISSFVPDARQAQHAT